MHYHQNEDGIVRSPYGETEADRSPSQDPTLPSSNPQTMGHRKDPCLPSRKVTVSALGHSRGHALLAGAARRSQVREVMVKHRTRHPTAQARSRVVDTRPRLQEWRPI